MIIDFKEIEEQILPSFKGGEKEMQIIYLLKGEATVCYDGQETKLLPGQVHYCPMGHSHSLMNQTKEELQFFAVVPEHH